MEESKENMVVFSNFFIVVGILILIPIGSVLEALDWQDPELEKFVQFFVLIISFLAVFLDSKRLQDRSINGLSCCYPICFICSISIWIYIRKYFQKDMF